MKVAFDVDGTLINSSDEPRYEVIDLLRWFYNMDYTIIAWSGGGLDYTRQWLRRLGLDCFVMHICEKCSMDVDIAVDDAMDSENWGNEHKCKVVIKV